MPKTTRKAKPSKAEKEIGINDFDKWLDAEAERTGKSKQRIVEETFKDGFLTWTIEDTQAIVGEEKAAQKTISQAKMDSMIKNIEDNEKLATREKKDEAIATLQSRFVVQESAQTPAQAPPMLTAWAMPNVAEDIDELRRLRREFAPVSRAVDYIKSMIIGNDLDIEIEDPSDKGKKEIRDDILLFMKSVFQDSYTKTLFTLMSIMVDESLTVGASGAEIRYKNSDFKFMDFVTSQEKSTLPVAKSSTGGKDFIYYKTKEPDWGKLEAIVQLKVFKNANGRMKLYRDPLTWEANYWTLDEIVATGDTAMAMPQMALKPAGGQSQRFHPWQVFWLILNRREFDERGMSVISPVKNVALLLEKILNSIGEGIYRAGNKKYFIVCGTEKRPWSKPHIRNVMQQIQEMGRRNWTTVPVPYGFDIKEIGGNVFQANQIITVLLNMVAQGMHVPNEVLGVQIRAIGTTTGERVMTASFNEIEQMRFEFKRAIENQLFEKHLWCTRGKTKNKQGGKGSDPIYVPTVKCSTKGLLSPIERLEQIQKILNLANPVSPQMKLELERDMSVIMGYDNIDFETQEELKADLKKLTGTDKIIANPAAAKEQGKPEPQTLERTQERLKGGVNKGIQGGTRLPAESKARNVGEVFSGETFDRVRRRLQLLGMHLDPRTIQETLDYEENEFYRIQEASYIATNLGATASLGEPTTDNLSGQTKNKQGTDVTGYGAQKTGSNYGPQGYHNVVVGKGKFGHMKINKDAKGIMTFLNPMTQKEVTIVITPIIDGIAGYSEDMTKIYMDPMVPEWMYLGIIAHETLEQVLVEWLDFSYEWSHTQATLLERALCKELHINYKKYDATYKKILKDQEDRKPQPKNPADMHHRGKGAGEGQPSDKKDTSGYGTEIKGGMQHDKGEAGQERVGGMGPKRVVHEIEINVKTSPQELKITTEPLKIEQGKSEVVIVKTDKPELEKALKELTKQQTDTQKKFDTLSKELNDKQDALKTLQEERNKDSKSTKILTEEQITAEMTKINMEIVNLEAERRKTESEIRVIQETAQQKKALMEKIEKKLEEESNEE